MMGSVPTGRPYGRSKIEIDWKFVEERMEAGCTAKEIAGRFGINVDTLYTRVLKEYGSTFAELSAKKKEHGKGNIRWKQYNQAMKGNTQLLLRLGDVLLEQDKKVDLTPNDANIDLLFQMMNENKELKKKIADHESYENKIIIDERLNDDEPESTSLKSASDS